MSLTFTADSVLDEHWRKKRVALLPRLAVAIASSGVIETVVSAIVEELMTRVDPAIDALYDAAGDWLDQLDEGWTWDWVEHDGLRQWLKRIDDEHHLGDVLPRQQAVADELKGVVSAIRAFLTKEAQLVAGKSAAEARRLAIRSRQGAGRTTSFFGRPGTLKPGALKAVPRRAPVAVTPEPDPIPSPSDQQLANLRAALLAAEESGDPSAAVLRRALEAAGVEDLPEPASPPDEEPAAPADPPVPAVPFVPAQPAPAAEPAPSAEPAPLPNGFEAR